MSPPAIGFVTNLGVGMGEFDCCSSVGCGGGRTLTAPAPPPPPSTICSWCCKAVAADDVGGAVIGMKRLCLEPTVLGDCGEIQYASSLYPNTLTPLLDTLSALYTCLK